jgi:hypothetical protein
MKATPIRYAAVESGEQVKRMVFCRHYGSCLDYAIEQNWPGFSCEGCQGYERERMDNEQWEEDRNRCMALIYFVLFPKLKLQVCKSTPSFGNRVRKSDAPILLSKQPVGFMGKGTAADCSLALSC